MGSWVSAVSSVVADRCLRKELHVECLEKTGLTRRLLNRQTNCLETTWQNTYAFFVLKSGRPPAERELQKITFVDTTLQLDTHTNC